MCITLDVLSLKAIAPNLLAAVGVLNVKGIVHFEIKIWYLSAYPKGIQDVGVFFSSVFTI